MRKRGRTKDDLLPEYEPEIAAAFPSEAAVYEAL
jgi:hypothetical protein